MFRSPSSTRHGLRNAGRINHAVAGRCEKRLPAWLTKEQITNLFVVAAPKAERGDWLSVRDLAILETLGSLAVGAIRRYLPLRELALAQFGASE